MHHLNFVFNHTMSVSNARSFIRLCLLAPPLPTSHRAWIHIQIWQLRQGSCTRSSNRGFFECFLLFVREAFLQVLVMPWHTSEEFLHLHRVGSALLLRYDVSVPQFVNYIFHRLCLLFYQHNNIPHKRAEVQHFFENKFYFFSGRFLWLLRCKFCVLIEGTWLLLRGMV